MRKLRKIVLFGGWRQATDREPGRGSGAIFDQRRIEFFSRVRSGEREEKRENFFSLPSNFWTLIKKEERVKMAASVSWSQRWLRPEVSDSRSSSFFETTTDDTC